MSEKLFVFPMTNPADFVFNAFYYWVEYPLHIGIKYVFSYGLAFENFDIANSLTYTE
jgi:hypothetical protein